jgi:hypothetical protein
VPASSRTGCSASCTEADEPQAVAHARAALAYALAQLEQLAPAFRLHRRPLHRWLRPSDVAHPADLVVSLSAAVEALGAVGDLPRDELAPYARVVGGWARRVGDVRRRMRRPDAGDGPDEREAQAVAAAPAPGDAPVLVGVPELDRASEAIAELSRLFTPACWRALGGAA